MATRSLPSPQEPAKSRDDQRLRRANRQRKPLLGDPEPRAEAWLLLHCSRAPLRPERNLPLLRRARRHGFEPAAALRRGRGAQGGNPRSGGRTRSAHLRAHRPSGRRQRAAHPRQRAERAQQRDRASARGSGSTPESPVAREVAKIKVLESEGFRFEDREALIELLAESSASHGRSSLRLRLRRARDATGSCSTATVIGVSLRTGRRPVGAGGDAPAPAFPPWSRTDSPMRPRSFKAAEAGVSSKHRPTTSERSGRPRLGLVLADSARERLPLRDDATVSPVSARRSAPPEATETVGLRPAISVVNTVPSSPFSWARQARTSRSRWPASSGPAVTPWIRRIEADTRVRDTFEGAGGGQQARFVRRGLPTACMPSQSCRQRESTTLDSEESA